MAGVSRADVIAYLEALGPAELQELMHELAERWELEVPYRGEEVFTTMGVPIERDAYRYVEAVLLQIGPRRVQVMKAIREVVPLSVHEVKVMTDAVPARISDTLHPDQARALQAELEALGAKVELRETWGER